MTMVIKTSGFEDYLDEGGAYVKALIMGHPGAGKTRSASFWPRPIFADCEKGRMSIADRGVHYGEVRSIKAMDELLTHVEAEARKGKRRAYDTLVIDTIDSYQRICIQERLTSEKKAALSGWADWGFIDAQMTILTERVLNLPMNVVVNMHVKEKEEDDGDSKLVIVAPKLKGDIQYQITADFDLVGFMGTYWEAIDGERTLTRAIRWSPQPRWPVLKDRSGRLPQTTDIDFTDEDYYRLFNHIVGDHVENMPPTEVVSEVGEPDEDDAPVTGEQGGPVATIKQFPRRTEKKTTKKTPAKAVDVAPVSDEKGDATPAPTSRSKEAEEETDIDVPNSVGTANGDRDAAAEHEPTHEGAVKTVEKTLKGEVVSESGEVDESPKVKCGDLSPRAPVGAVPAEGCGKSLENEDKNKVNIALIRTATFLCVSCWETWRKDN